MAITPSESPIEVTVDGEAPETRMSHNTGTPAIATAAVGAVERNDPREYATNNNKMPTPITTTPASSTVEVTSLARALLVTADAKKSLNPIENVESTA